VPVVDRELIKPPYNEASFDYALTVCGIVFPK